MYDLKQQLIHASMKRDWAQAKLEKILEEQSNIAEGLRDYWKNQQAGSA